MVNYESIGLTLTVLLIGANVFLIADPGDTFNTDNTAGILSWLPSGLSDKDDVNAFESDLVLPSTVADANTQVTADLGSLPQLLVGIPIIGGLLGYVFLLIPLVLTLLFGWAIVLSNILTGTLSPLAWVIIVPIATIQVFSIAYLFLRLLGYFMPGGGSN